MRPLPVPGRLRRIAGSRFRGDRRRDGIRSAVRLRAGTERRSAGGPRMNGADRLPRLVPLLYFGTAYVSLALACVLAAIWPRAVAGFFYHSWMVAIVHLVTLGWITFSILGAIYIVGPVALGMPMPARRGDYWAYGCAIVGVIGMVAHVWIQEFGGMAWSAGTVTLGILFVVCRILRALPQARMQPAVKLHLVFACVNIAIAASMGILLGFD